MNVQIEEIEEQEFEKVYVLRLREMHQTTSVIYGTFLIDRKLKREQIEEFERRFNRISELNAFQYLRGLGVKVIPAHVIEAYVDGYREWLEDYDPTRATFRVKYGFMWIRLNRFHQLRRRKRKKKSRSISSVTEEVIINE